MRRTRQYFVLTLWLLLLLGLWFGSWRQGKTPLVLLRDALATLKGEPLAPLLLGFIYLLRPLFLLPVSVLTVATGALFGAVWGTLYAGVATLVTATLAYLLGRLFGDGLPAEAQRGWVGRLKAYPFETVLLSRVLFVPGDLVNYLAGYLKVNVVAFIGATAVGGMPGLLIGVLAGASLESTSATSRINLNYLLASALLLAISLAVSWWMRRRAAAIKP